MPTQDKFFLHDATTTVGGTLPGASTLSATTPTATVSGASTNRVMDGTISVTSQTSVALTTQANQNAQPSWFRRWVSDPIGVNDFGTGSLLRLRVSFAASQSNSASAFSPLLYFCWIWRPSSGAIVAVLLDRPDIGAGAPGTSQTVNNAATTLDAAGTSADGDVIVVEFWRGNRAQTMSSAYTNTFFFDGTTESSTSNIASWIAFADGLNVVQPVEMSSGAPPAADMLDALGMRGFYGA